MKGPIFIFTLTTWFALQALFNPHIGLLAYFGYAVLCPSWNWRWSLPDLDYQKYIAIPTLIGFFIIGFRGNRLQGASLVAALGLVLYVFLALLSSFQSIRPADSWFYMNNIWKIALMALLAFRLLDAPQKIIACMWVVVLAQGYNAYNVNELYFKYGINQDGFQWNFLNNNTYSISTIPTMGLSAALAVYSTRLWQRVLAGTVFVLQMHQLMMLGCRGSMVGGLLLVALGVIFMPKTRRSFTYVVSGFVVGSVLAGPSVVEEFKSSFKPKDELDYSAESRYELWQAGYKITMDYPLLGVGTWAAQYIVPAYFQDYREERPYKALHNLFFEVSTGSGIPAVIALLTYYWAVWLAHVHLWLYRWHVTPEWARCASTGVLTAIPAFWLSSMFSSGGLIESPYICAAVGAATLLVVRANGVTTAALPHQRLRTAGTRTAQPLANYPAVSAT